MKPVTYFTVAPVVELNNYVIYDDVRDGKYTFCYYQASNPTEAKTMVKFFRDNLSIHSVFIQAQDAKDAMEQFRVCHNG